MGYRVVVRVREARGRCAIGYQPGDTFTVERALLSSTQQFPVLYKSCFHLTLFIEEQLKCLTNFAGATVRLA
jgi:uncharacterized repeat protein (TIGR04076 family)